MPDDDLSRWIQARLRKQHPSAGDREIERACRAIEAVINKAIDTAMPASPTMKGQGND